MRFAFSLVGDEYPLGQVPGEDSGELPGEVGRVAQSGAHALADERRCEVGGIAEQEDPARAPAVGELRAEGVIGDPDQFEFLDRNGAGPRADQSVQSIDVAVVVRGFLGPSRNSQRWRVSPMRMYVAARTGSQI